MAEVKTLQELLIDKMEELEEDYRALLDIRQQNRNTLRSLAKQGVLSKEHTALVNEVYPPRAPKGSKVAA